jgi:ABC-type amino acid transport substrate-binding protein
VPDGKYGKKNNGAWNGLIGQVYNEHARMAAAPITISDDRTHDVDFTKPFMTFGTVILIRKPTNGSEHAIKGIKDLVGHPSIKYGVVKDGMTESLFSTSTVAYIRAMKEHLNNVDSQHIGVDRVRADGKYAFILEANTADYWIKQHCDLDKVPVTEFTPRSYAFVLKKGSADTHKVGEAIEALQKDHELDKLKAKWWKGDCSGASRSLGVAATGAFVMASLVTLLAKM